MATLIHIATNQGNILETQNTSGYVCAGNLIKNGRFENGLVHWNHGNVRVVSGHETHEGNGAAGLGAYRQNLRSAWLFQCIPLPQSGDPLFLQLFFSVAGFRNAPAPLDVTLSWFDANIAPIDHGIQASIKRRAIGNGSVGKWSTYTFVSDQVPQGADFAVLRFYKRPGVQSKNFLVVDDVVLVPVVPSCYYVEESLNIELAQSVEATLLEWDFTGSTSE